MSGFSPILLTDGPTLHKVIVMKVVEIKNVQRKDIPLHYRRVFTGNAMLEHIGGDEPSRIEFALERQPLGKTSVRVEIKDAINYPLVPAIRVLSEHIKSLDAQGQLP